MSRGPGRLQRLILAALADQEAFYLRALLGPACTRAQYNGLLRAARALETDGKINIHRFGWGASPGVGKTVVHRIGTTFTGTDRRALGRLSDEQVTSGNSTNT